ncbi:S1 family peptidase [Streptomyces zingiberis]|uniref:S1 family peptidase n=1 Tax=Streptomyces zingiberis TaxID=2053010 RepID=A0ABX1BXY9_9ACTN|nr:alpha-lytic protease prodomain-containing protein [Streptomyces zingiberis]NJQ01346.1 S1 family peptidase [Streptomyces zingiberis]
MKHRRIPRHRIAVAGAAAAALAAGALTLNSANAAPAPTPSTLSVASADKLADNLLSELGKEAAGSYYDADAKRLVVNVLNEKAATDVREQGAVARVVEHSLADLKAARSTLEADATIPGTSWSVDPKSNKVVVTADSTVKGAKLEKLNKVVDGLDGRATVERVAGEFTTFASGGQAIYSGGARCSLGFNVVKGGEPYFITAGHCGSTGSTWSTSSGGSAIGTMEESSFPGNDYALVKYTSGGSQPSEVDLYNGSSQTITQAGNATVGQEVQRSGSTTQVHGGEVTGLNETVNYQEGSVSGLIKTTVCAEPGDSGGSLFAGSTALGLTSGGSGNCSSGGTTFFQPVPEALSAFGASIG